MLTIESLVQNTIGVWTGTVPMEEYAIGAILLFLPWVILAHVGHWATGVKELEKLRNLLIGAAIIVALGPVAIPVGSLFLAYRYFFPPPKKEKRPSSSTARV